jgi:hypothetical protein
MRKTIGLLGICPGLLAVVPLFAHHGSAGYDTRSPMTITGTIRGVELVNPLPLSLSMSPERVGPWSNGRWKDPHPECWSGRA